MSDQGPRPAAGGRYQRSMSGMVGAMIVTVAVVVAFVVFRAVNRDDAETRPEPVDYLRVVGEIQRASAGDAGMQVLYPPKLPRGWIATTAAFDAGRLWSLSVLTGEDHYLGVRQGPGTVEDFVAEYVDEDAVEGDQVRVSGDRGEVQRWQTWTDDGGDYALVRTVPPPEGGSPAAGEPSPTSREPESEEEEDRIVILVLGTAGAEQVRDFAADLTTSRVG